MSKFHAIYSNGGVSPEPPVIATKGVPFYPTHYAWSWDNSSNSSKCTVTYTFTYNVNISEATGDFSTIVGNHSKNTTFTIEKRSTFDAPSSGKNAEITGGDSIKWTITEEN